MTCKDCLHIEACISMLQYFGFTVDGDGKDADKRCKEFQSAADVVDKKTHEEVCKQIMWERDVAIAQLKEIGKSLGEKMSDVAPVAHGRWTKTEDDYYGLNIVKCSVCREEWCFEVEDDVFDLNYHYCPNCGAKMDLEVQDEVSKETCCN